MNYDAWFDYLKLIESKQKKVIVTPVCSGAHQIQSGLEIQTQKTERHPNIERFIVPISSHYEKNGDWPRPFYIQIFFMYYIKRPRLKYDSKSERNSK